MMAYLTLTRRELGAFFLSLRGYVVIGMAAFLTGLSFLSLMSQLQGAASSVMPITEMFCYSWFWFVLLFSSPVITMRLFALEKSSGTFETLMTTPISDLQVVLAKFTAALFFFLVLWLPLAGSILLLRFVAHDPTLTDPGTMSATFLGIFLIGALYMAMGCFASALTNSQIVAAMISFALGLGSFILGYIVEQFPMDKSWTSELLGYMSMHAHMADFARGIIDTRYIVFYVSLTLFFLFLTYRVVESRRWK
jgi:ABC-2 type transport system permease protein